MCLREGFDLPSQEALQSSSRKVLFSPLLENAVALILDLLQFPVTRLYFWFLILNNEEGKRTVHSVGDLTNTCSLQAVLLF